MPISGKAVEYSAPKRATIMHLDRGDTLLIHLQYYGYNQKEVKYLPRHRSR